jgi:ribosomal protein S4
MVVHGKVQLNGLKHSNPNTKLDPGDMFTVDPSAIIFLRDTAAAKSEETSKSEDSSGPAETAAEKSDSIEAATESSDGAKEVAEKTPEVKNTNPWFKPGMTSFNLPAYASPFLFVPPYLEPSFLTCSAIYVRHPTARPDYSEIPTPYEADGEIMRLAWEWYAKMRPRMRGKRQAATGEKGRKRW